jgi:hypothetical protein
MLYIQTAGFRSLKFPESVVYLLLVCHTLRPLLCVPVPELFVALDGLLQRARYLVVASK